MTREERARKMAQQVAEPAAGIERFRPVLTVQEAVEVALTFADAEAAVMRERAADRFKQAVQADYPDFDCMHEPEWQGCIACYDIALIAAVDEVRALPATGEE